MHLFSKTHAHKWLLLPALLVSQWIYAQTVTLSVSNEPLEKVLNEVERQTGYSFIYSSEAMTGARPVSISVKNETLNSFLQLCFRDQPFNYQFQGRHIVLRIATPTVHRAVLRGRVTNLNDEPVAGATITIKGTDNSTSTDANGEFELRHNTPSPVVIVTGAELEATEKPTNGIPFVYIIVRARIDALDEAIVMAYGKTTRRYATGTIGSVKKKDIVKQPVSNPLAVLSGQISGLQVIQESGVPGSSYSVRVRGQNSIANGNEPLIIIDGVPFPSTTLNSLTGGGKFGSPLANLNPADIESIEVLKDADATAIYGSRGANGVILITTRKGHHGKTSVSMRTYAGIGKPTRFMDLLGTGDYLEMRREAFANDGIMPLPAQAPDVFLWDTTRYTDWQKEMMGHTMMTADSKVELSGGTAQTQFLLGLGYHRETTTMPGNDFAEQKFSFNLNLTHASTNQRLRVSVMASFLRNQTFLPQADLSSYMTLPPTAPPLYTDDGKLNWANSTWVNPLSNLLKTYSTDNENFISNLGISYRIMRGLEFRTNIGYNVMRVEDHQATPMSSFDPSFPSAPAASFGRSSIHTLITEPQLSYTLSKDTWKLEALAGATIQETNNYRITHTGTGYASDDLINSLAAASTITTGVETDNLYRYLGIFGRMNTTWRNRYILSLTGRRDGSSRYGPENRFASFGSAGVAWLFGNEAWVRKIKSLSFGKLKLSYGTTGNDQIGDYKFLDTWSPYVLPYFGLTPFVPNQLFSPSYNWELVRKWEGGIELGFFKDRLLVGGRYYYNLTDNQLVNYALPPSTGFGGVLRNLPARIANNGVELELSGSILEKHQFSWNASFNLTIPRNKLLRFDNIEGSSYANTYVVGRSLFIIRRYEYVDVDPQTGLYRFTDFDHDGKISSPNDRQAIVFTGQQYYGGLSQSLTWKKFSMSLFLQFVRQRYAGNHIVIFSRPGIARNQPVSVMDRWQQPGDITSIQKFTNTASGPFTAYANYQLSDATFSDASFVRLRNLYLSYDLLKPALQKRGFKRLSVFAQGQNLLVLTKYDSMDPETRTSMPPVRMFTVGFELEF